jgi:hypothetical protein
MSILLQPADDDAGTDPTPSTNDSAPDASADEPTLDEWRSLYAAAVRFRDLAPWEWMWDDRTFGVENPETGEIGYCCVMGRLREHFALGVYRGTPALVGLWDRWLSPPPVRATDALRVLETQDCVMASFEDREELTAPDRAVIKALGLKFRGRSAWPQMRSYVPGSVPWYLSGAEARFLTVALKQAVIVTQRLQDDPDLLPDPAPLGPYLVRVRDGRLADATAAVGAEEVWRDELLAPEPLPGPKITTFRINGEVIAPLRALPRTDAVLELAIERLPEPIQQSPRSRPVFPYILLAVLADPPDVPRLTRIPVNRARRGKSPRKAVAPRVQRGRSGIVAGTQIALPDDAQRSYLDFLPTVIAGLAARPAHVIVQGEGDFELLAPMADLLDVDLTLESSTPAVNAAMRSIINDFATSRPR